jgi:hypothetical protein
MDVKTYFPEAAKMEQKDFLKFLVANKRSIIDKKKFELKRTVDYDNVAFQRPVSKGKYRYENNTNEAYLVRTIVANTYLWCDSHGDVHLPNIFSKSIQERGDLICHIADHNRETEYRVGIPLLIYEKEIPWYDLGVAMKGNTMSLILESKIIKDFNPGVYSQYLNDAMNQHSVLMQYVKMDIAINDPEQEEYALWQKWIDLIGNPQACIEQGFFFAIAEAKLIEISAVIEGSNAITPTLKTKKKEPSKDTHQETEPQKHSQIDVSELINKFKQTLNH